MTKTTALLLGALLFIALIAAMARKKGGKANKKKGVITPKIPLTKNEQPMYFRLIESFPNDIVLAQVAFSALLKSTDQGTRNKFNKVADFVLCTKAFAVTAIIELDDASHKGRQKEDDERDALLTSAGYRVFRYKQTPDVQKLLTDIGT